MGDLVVFDNIAKKVRKADDVELAEKIVDMTKNKDRWEVISELVNTWSKRTPEEFQGFKIQTEALRSGLHDRKFGQTKEGRQMERRLTMVFPHSLFLMIRSVYKAQELPMDKRFYAEFLHRFPFFKIPDKI